MEISIFAEIFFTVFLLNANPIFTIPTWIVVFFFAGMNDTLPILPAILIGISASALGRYTLAWYSNKFGKTILSKKQRKNMEYFKDFFINSGRPITSFVFAFLYALSPLPTNTLFLVAGIAQANVIIIMLGFFFGELLSGIVYLTVLESALESVTFSNLEYFLIGGIGIILGIAVILIDWKKMINSLTKKEMERKTQEAIREMYKE